MSNTSETQEVDNEIIEANQLVRRLTFFTYIGIAVAVIVVSIYAMQFGGSLSKKPDEWGQFGDYVGGLLNPTFSLLALLALLTTLGLQIRELKFSVKELRNSATALTKQNETLRLQTFEGTFFQVLRLYNDIVTAMQVRQYSGRDCLHYYTQILEDQLEAHNAIVSYSAFLVQYDAFYEENQTQLSHYFRMLYNIIKLVKNTDGIDRKFYTNLVRAQLSSAELNLLFYNCLSNHGNQKFKPLVEEFSLLKSMSLEKFPPDSELTNRYAEIAFE